MQFAAAMLAALLVLSATSASASRTLSAADKVQITNGEVSSDNLDKGVPAGRACVGSGMSCSSSSQCCSKSCNRVYFRCG